MADVDAVIETEIPIAKLLRALKAIDPELRKGVVRRVKEIGKPVELAIKSNLPQVAPLSGMNNGGRLGWGVGKPANSTTLAFKASASKTDAITPLLSVKVNSAASAMADIAGRKGQGNTRSGRAMIAKLNAISGASRFVYPAGEKAMPGVVDEIQNTIDEVSRIIEKEYA